LIDGGEGGKLYQGWIWKGEIRIAGHTGVFLGRQSTFQRMIDIMTSEHNMLNGVGIGIDWCAYGF